ncbi:MAG: hypothetical protein M1828_003885 [Chrysothrix sp. TS-e1954]|nr:MAG: hypothetical protein M1828_003885 [Chrysothrix sp. TS-e1954]
MLSLRALSRQAPRSLRTLSSCTARRSLNVYRTPSVLQASWRQASIRPTAAFSTTSRQFESEGQVNIELSGKLESELNVEREMRDPDSMPEHLKEYLDNSPFKLQDNAGQEEVVLTRTFGDEKIRVAFSIDDLNNVDEDADNMTDRALDDESQDPSDMPTDTQSGGASSKGAINQGRTSGGNFKVAPEDSVAEADRPEDEQAQPAQEQEPSFPAHLHITVERPGRGALALEAIAQDGLMIIDNVHFWKDARLVEPKTSEQETAAAKSYTGPPFGNLDEDLQVLFEKYMDERGVNTTLALFIPEYIDYKEQREYLSWLTNVKKFVD